jgi:hypothetical protein
MANITQLTQFANVLTVYVDDLTGIDISVQVQFAGLTLTPLATLLNGTTQTVASISGSTPGSFTVNPFVAANFPLGSASDAETGTATPIIVPVCPPTIPLMAPPFLGGWSTLDLIEQADRRTERRGSKVLDLNSEFISALQNFCMERRWYWRRRWATMYLTPGVWQYDISQPAVNCGPAMDDFQQFCKHGVRYYQTSSNWGEITPVFERDLQSAGIYSNTYAPNPAPPQQYFMNPHLVLNILPVPDKQYPITLDYWAVPNLSPTTLPDLIPLVPAYLKNVLLKRLEAQIFRYTIGEGAAKYQAAMGEYNALVDKYAGMDGWVPGEHIDWSADDDYESNFANAQNAVQSTR